MNSRQVRRDIGVFWIATLCILSRCAAPQWPEIMDFVAVFGPLTQWNGAIEPQN